jgi:predicted TIM-barrel fold metal-dependent hydrolase
VRIETARIVSAYINPKLSSVDVNSTNGQPPRTFITIRYATARRRILLLEAFGKDHLVTGSDYPVLQDYESYAESFAYIEWFGLPKSMTNKALHQNAQKLFGFLH